MKFIVGYPLKRNEDFLDTVLLYREHIREVYFSWGDFPNGRHAPTDAEEETLFERQARQLEDLSRLCKAGISANLLFNGNCYGAESLSRTLFHRIGNTVSFLRERLPVTCVTTSSPLIARFLHENFTGIDVRASVNMEIGTPEGASYVASYFDSLYVKRECNRDRKALLRMRAWCEANGKEMLLLANSGCLRFCSAHTFHDNLVAHESEIAKMDNGYDFHGICHAFLSENKSAYLERGCFIRPEDIPLYEEFTPAVKLATRVNPNPSRVISAYIRGEYSGSLPALLEPDHTALFFPNVLENARLPKDFGTRVLHCDKDCTACGYCERAFRDGCIDLGGYNIADSKND